MTRKEERRLATLQRRADHLKHRVATGKLKDYSYDKQEVAALEWAIDTINVQKDKTKLLEQEVSDLYLKRGNLQLYSFPIVYPTMD